MDTPPYHIIPWEDATGLGRDLRAYDCYDDKGRKIKITPKHFENHTSYHPLQSDPALFYNLRMVVSAPHRTIINPPSNNPIAIQNRQKGDVVVYSMKGLIGQLNFPSFPPSQIISDEVQVFVQYNNMTGENYSLTYRINISHD